MYRFGKMRRNSFVMPDVQAHYLVSTCAFNNNKGGRSGKLADKNNRKVSRLGARLYRAPSLEMTGLGECREKLGTSSRSSLEMTGLGECREKLGTSSRSRSK